jgi:NitT/TauT family transport system ATP-binding protein
LDSIDLSVNDSEFIAIVGPSGCGKTSILRIVGGLLDKSEKHVDIAGSVLVNGVAPRVAKKARMFGFAFQNPVLLPWRTVRENVGLPLEILGNKASIGVDSVTALLQLMDVQDFADSYPHELSGGIQQRVNIARALVHQPSILLMDEPFGSLDEVTRERLNLALLNIHRLKGTTILFVTHSLREAAFLANRIIILSKRPARIKAIITSRLPENRTEAIQTESVFLDLLAEVKSLFFSEEGKT